MDRTLLKNYIKGECDAAEARKVKQWIDSDQFDQDLLNSIEKDLQQELNSHNTIIPKENLQQKIKAVYQKAGQERKFNDSAKSFYGNTFLKIAASVVLLLTISLLIFEKSQSPPSSSESIAKIIIKANDQGRKSTIFLPDGSVVNLNSESSIQYDEANFEIDRTILLKGEAFFEVAEDSIHPFRVIANQVTVTALGTSFNVDSYQDGEQIHVALVSGKVLVNNATENLPREEYFLNPGQAISYQKENMKFSAIAPFRPEKVTGWKDGILYFDQDDLSTVLQKLERWFAVDFELMNKSPYTWRYTSKFKNQNLKNILESLSFTQNFNYEIKGKKVIIEFN